MGSKLCARFSCPPYIAWLVQLVLALIGADAARQQGRERWEGGRGGRGAARVGGVGRNAAKGSRREGWDAARVGGVGGEPLGWEG